MSVPPEHLRSLVLQWEQFRREEQHNAPKVREILHRPTNQTMDMTACQDPMGIRNPSMAVPADPLALMESMKSIFQSGLASNTGQIRSVLQNRAPPPLYNSVERSNISRHVLPRGPPPLISLALRQPPPAHSSSAPRHSLRCVNLSTSHNQFRPEMPPHVNQSAQNLVQFPVPPYINKSNARNQPYPDVCCMNTIRIMNPFETEQNIPRTRTSPNFPGDTSVVHHGMRTTSSQNCLQNISTSWSVNNDNLPQYVQRSSIEPRMFSSPHFPHQYPGPGFLHHSNVENYPLMNIMSRMPDVSHNPFSEFIIHPPHNQISTNQNSVSQATEDLSDKVVMDRWYKPPSNEIPEVTNSLEAPENLKPIEEQDSTERNLTGHSIKKEMLSDNVLDRIHRPSKQSLHSNLENVVYKLRQKEVVFPICSMASTFYMSRESPTHVLDSVPSAVDTQVETRESPTQFSDSVLSAVDRQVEDFSVNRDVNTTPMLGEQSTHEISPVLAGTGKDVSEVQSDQYLVKSPPGIGLCILNTFSLANNDIGSPQNGGTFSVLEQRTESCADKSSSKNTKKSSRKKVPPLRIKLTFNRGSPKKTGFGSPKKTFGSPMKSAFHHFAKGAKKLIDLRKPKALIFENEMDETSDQAHKQTNQVVEQKNELKVAATEVVAPSHKGGEKKFDDVVEKLKKQRKRRRSALLIDSEGSIVNTKNPKDEKSEKNSDQKKQKGRPKKVKDTVIVTDKKDIHEEKAANTEDSGKLRELSVLENMEVSDNLNKEERNRELIEKNWVQIEARLKMFEKRLKESKNRSPVKKSFEDPAINTEKDKLGNKKKCEGNNNDGETMFKKSLHGKDAKTGANNEAEKLPSKRNSPRTKSHEKIEAESTPVERKSPRNVKSIGKSDLHNAEKLSGFKSPQKSGSGHNNVLTSSSYENVIKLNTANADSSDKPSKSRKLNGKSKSPKRSKQISSVTSLSSTPIQTDELENGQKNNESLTSDQDVSVIREEWVDNSNHFGETLDDITQTISKITYPTFFVTFHGKRVLCLNSSSGKLLLMREILRRNFKEHVKSSKSTTYKKDMHYKQVYLAKERDLKIKYMEIPPEHKSLAYKYLLAEKLLKEKKKIPQHLGVISLENALRLYHFMYGMRACSGDDKCMAIWSPPDESENCSSSQLDKDNKSDTVANNNNIGFSNESLTNSNSCNDGYESDVTIPYVDEPDKTENSAEDQSQAPCVNKSGNISQDKSYDVDGDDDDTDSKFVLRGGVAECYGSYFRYIVVEGEKFYPYEDLVLKFGKIALTQALQSRLPEKFRAYKCTEIEADFINKLEETLPTLSLEATLLEEALFKKVASTLEFFKSNTVVDLTQNDVEENKASSDVVSASGITVDGMEVDLTLDDSRIDVDDKRNLCHDDSVIEVDSPESPKVSVQVIANQVSQSETMKDIPAVSFQSSQNIGVQADKTDLNTQKTTKRKFKHTKNVKAPCDSTSDIGILGDRIPASLEDNNNNENPNEQTSMLNVENDHLTQQFNAMLNELEKEFSVSSGSDISTEDEISNIAKMQKLLEEAIAQICSDMSPSSGTMAGDDMDMKHAIKVCMETFKESNNDMTQTFMKILKQAVVQKAKLSALKHQLSEFKNGTDRVLSSCHKYEEMLSELQKNLQGEG